MYLTKIEMQLSNPGVRAALRDSQKMHRLVTGFFQTGRAEAQILYRKRTRGMNVELYLYSAVPVVPEKLLPGMQLVAQREITSWLETMQEGDIWGFSLLTAPFKKVAVEGSRNSRRRALATREERLAWLARKGEQNGFSILSVEEAEDEKLTARHSEDMGGSLVVNSYCYSGCLKITDASLFRRSVCQGIGPEKAYGLGMLLLRMVS